MRYTMKKIVFVTMGIIAMALTSCKEQAEQPWIVDRFDDVKIIRYEVPEFENQSLNDKLLIYYLAISRLPYSVDLYRFNLLVDACGSHRHSGIRCYYDEYHD